jgi:hypothetical protein
VEGVSLFSTQYTSCGVYVALVAEWLWVVGLFEGTVASFGGTERTTKIPSQDGWPPGYETSVLITTLCGAVIVHNEYPWLICSLFI